jgi:hypothetical protein
MTSENLAILITPCIFRPKEDNIFKELIEIKKLILVSTLIMQN